MIKREDLIGTIHGEWLITGLAGEGAEGVVYVVAPIDKPEKSELVIKMFKPLVFLEMNVLHHDFKVHEDLYPDHPLLMSSEERLQLLCDEMLGRIKNFRSVFRLSALDGLYDHTLELLGAIYFEDYKNDGDKNINLFENEGINIFYDDVLMYKLEESLEEELIIEDAIEFYELVLETIEGEIVYLKENGEYCKVSNNCFCMLIGLYMEGFINEEEVEYIVSQKEFEKLIEEKTTWCFFNFITVLYYNVISKIKNLPEKDKEEDLDKEIYDEYPELKNYDYNKAVGIVEKYLRSIVLCCDLLIFFSGQEKWNDKVLSGLGHLWMAKTYLLYNNEKLHKKLISMLNSAINLFSETESLTNKHDALIELAEIYSRNKNKSKALKCIVEAKLIRKEIGYEDHN